MTEMPGTSHKLRIVVWLAGAALVVSLSANVVGYVTARHDIVSNANAISQIQVLQHKSCALGQTNRDLVTADREYVRSLAVVALRATRRGLQYARALHNQEAINYDLGLIEKFKVAASVPHIPPFICPFPATG